MDVTRQDRGALEIASRTEPPTTEADIFTTLQSLVMAHRFRHFLVMALPGATVRQLSEVVMMTDWPATLLRRYDAASLFTGSPIIKRLRRSTVPFVFDIGLLPRKDEKSDAALEFFAHARLKRGIYIPVHDARGQCGVVGFGGDREPVSHEEMKILTFTAADLFARLCAIRREQIAGERLSRREIECLSWAAAGKTTLEMAQILNLSEYTINHYLNRASRKLNTVNRVQTVAQAMRAGLIH
ncbi:LuxR family transcriptional regulator [Rhizobium rhizosphaerae]|uniref:LuxR family transcriptional regulator n=1 Tax=Xaviernesmea rhizosphaerae TaxID=1672749 RepID=A0A1Q9AH41_9HYPH|nr:LuxR family transcriptional regulator [Xaviernesmea rhizosphaerae]OLP54526.1 LuxR family transcriptional regulator [Xaviernesmea rhizosphaerae]